MEKVDLNNFVKNVDGGLLAMKNAGEEMVNQDVVAIWLLLSGYGIASEWINSLKYYEFDHLVEIGKLI